jgi:hypothetical protein
MILISHRGNIDGKSEYENMPKKIDNAISLGFDVEIDLRVINDQFFLGHDKGEYKISINWLLDRSNKLWIHCKDIVTIEHLSLAQESRYFNYFFHDSDLCTLTSKGYLWVYPGFQPVRNSIAVMPEYKDENIKSCIGICSDKIEFYKNIIGE